MAVLRQPGDSEPLRGDYALEVVAEAGDVGDRSFGPSANVERSAGQFRHAAGAAKRAGTTRAIGTLALP